MPTHSHTPKNRDFFVLKNRTEKLESRARLHKYPPDTAMVIRQFFFCSSECARARTALLRFPCYSPQTHERRKKIWVYKKPFFLAVLCAKNGKPFFFHPWSLEMEANECSEHNLSATRHCWVPTKYRTGFSFFSFFWECPSFPFPPLH